MLASAGQPPRPGTGWAAETKWDGARILARCTPDRTVALPTRILRVDTSSFPEIADALARAGRGRHTQLTSRGRTEAPILVGAGTIQPTLRESMIR